nr:sugar transport protein 13 [Tanacetum cinerariifolium]
ALLVVDTPNSLIERGKLEEGKAVLIKIRGTENIEPEYLELVAASRIAKEVKHPFRNLLQRKNRPQLIIAVALQFFQQFTGINAIMFYAPTDGEAMINYVQNGDQPFPVIAQVSLARNAHNAPPTLKDLKF